MRIFLSGVRIVAMQFVGVLCWEWVMPQIFVLLSIFSSVS
jgi:hypothetical protein